MSDVKEFGSTVGSDRLRAAMNTEKIVSETQTLIEAALLFFENGKEDDSIACMYMAGDRIKEYWKS